MRHTLLTVFLTLGVVGGIAAGCRSLPHGHQGRDAFEAHVAQLCVEAAQRNWDHKAK